MARPRRSPAPAPMHTAANCRSTPMAGGSVKHLFMAEGMRSEKRAKYRPVLPSRWHYTTPFNAKNPVNTPRGLASENTPKPSRRWLGRSNFCAMPVWCSTCPGRGSVRHTQRRPNTDSGMRRVREEMLVGLRPCKLVPPPQLGANTFLHMHFNLAKYARTDGVPIPDPTRGDTGWPTAVTRAALFKGLSRKINNRFTAYGQPASYRESPAH